ncbi:hypothetical protein BDN72DRAFT_847158 [Pluteus cervinus]|uniref:Uncharacterized protein n=1 Tax=Pluteus cervinus TaxID=181527 RepID=A0ACD3AE44_9AGAR|nr:hypothetical protein BDN72DRAFT_847158 [Pluteus cervinus]
MEYSKTAKRNRTLRRILVRGALQKPRILGFIAVSILLYTWFSYTRDKSKLPPPSYKRLWKWQQDLPQHNLNLPFPEGRTGRYLKFSCEIKQLGWNNVFNELLMNAHLAYETQRAFVFQDYFWKDEYYQWPESRSYWSTSYWYPMQTPLNALISGPTAGGPWAPGDDTPRSVSNKYWKTVCPSRERKRIYTRDIKPAIANSPGDEIFAHWKKIILDTPERCVEIVPAPRKQDNYPQVFDLWLWGSSRILPLWESFSKSPVSQLLDSSPIVKAAIVRNKFLFSPRDRAGWTKNPYDRMMAMHIRRGDFKEACLNLAYWNSTFYSWNLMPSLPDPLDMPLHLGWNTPAYNVAILERCLPDAESIVDKARRAREEYLGSLGSQEKNLDIMYLLTNEKGEWLEEMKKALEKDGWSMIVTSSDLELNSEETDVSMAIDMDIARMAAVFIGNGWSSFTSNIVHRRFIDGKLPISMRFW